MLPTRSLPRNSADAPGHASHEPRQHRAHDSASRRLTPRPPAAPAGRPGRCRGSPARARTPARSGPRRRGRRCRASGSGRGGSRAPARPAPGPPGRGRAARARGAPRPPSPARRSAACRSGSRSRRRRSSCCVARISVAFSARPSRLSRSISRRPSREASRNHASSNSTTLCTERSPDTSRIAYAAISFSVATPSRSAWS